MFRTDFFSIFADTDTHTHTHQAAAQQHKLINIKHNGETSRFPVLHMYFVLTLFSIVFKLFELLQDAILYISFFVSFFQTQIFILNLSIVIAKFEFKTPMQVWQPSEFANHINLNIQIQ